VKDGLTAMIGGLGICSGDTMMEPGREIEKIGVEEGRSRLVMVFPVAARRGGTGSPAGPIRRDLLRGPKVARRSRSRRARASADDAGEAVPVALGS
jgi:hypothetical protein